MEIKGFKDGATFVLTFDGANQTLIDELVNKYKPTLLEPVAADPVIMEQGETETSKTDYVEPADRAFEKGPLKGMTTVQALDELKDRAFRILSFYVSSGKLPKDMHKYCASCLNDYVSFRFEKYIGQTGAEVLRQVAGMPRESVNEFIELFTPLIKAEMWKAIGAQPENVAKLNEKQQQALATLIIIRGAKISGK